MMGGSLALAIKKHKIAKYIYAYDKCQISLDYGKSKKIITDYDTTDYKYLKNADIIFVCTPIGSYKKALSVIKNFKKNTAIITDIGSTKSLVNKYAEQILSDNESNYIGSHPLTGKEVSSIENSSHDLYRSAVVLITPILNTSPKTKSTIKKIWSNIKSKVHIIPPDIHDHVMSLTSHLPHLVSFALVNIILSNNAIDNIKKYTGGGFKDFARLANSDPIMWADICKSNKKNIISSVNLLKKELDTIKKLI